MNKGQVTCDQLCGLSSAVLKDHEDMEQKKEGVDWDSNANLEITNILNDDMSVYLIYLHDSGEHSVCRKKEIWVEKRRKETPNAIIKIFFKIILSFWKFCTIYFLLYSSLTSILDPPIFPMCQTLCPLLNLWSPIWSFILFIDMNALPAFISVYQLCAWCPQNPEEDIGSSVTWVTGGCDSLCEC